MKEQLGAFGLRALRSGLTIILLLFSSALSAQLSPAIQVDLYLVRAEREFGVGDTTATLATLDSILELQRDHELELPMVFWFKFAQVSHSTGNHEQALESAIRYLEIAGQSGEHYVAALELYDAAEIAQTETLERTALLTAAFPEMVQIAPGRILIECASGQGCEDDGGGNEIYVPQPFMVSQHEVTFAQWDACVEDGGCDGYRPDDEGWGRGDHPVINVNLEDIQSYLAWLTRVTGQEYRLLSDAEWEYVARAGSAPKSRWGDSIGFDHANCDGCESQRENAMTAPVGSFAPNPWMIYDMYGNVWELVSSGTPRGGSWLSSPGELRTRLRPSYSTGVRYKDVGFRVAQTLIP